jgi:hypothetical protein
MSQIFSRRIRNGCENPSGNAVTCVDVGKCVSDNQPTATLNFGGNSVASAMLRDLTWRRR